MPEILLVNPRRRGAKKKKAKRRTTRRRNPVQRKKRRTAAQKRATRKMIAANRRRARSSKRRSNPVRRKKVTRRKTTARRAPVRRRRRAARRSNPSFSMRSIQSQVTEAGIGAIGALGLDVVQGYLPIPANLKGGIVGTGVKALLAIGLGVVAQKSKLVKGSTAANMANGALVVILHDELKGLVQNFAPGVQMGAYLDDGMGYYGSGVVAGNLTQLDTDSFDLDSGMGAYLHEEPQYA